MPETIIFGPVAGAVVGGLMSDGGEQQTATKEPWSAAAPWLRQQLEQGQNLQAYYQQNPGTTSSRRPTRTRLPTSTSSATPWHPA